MKYLTTDLPSITFQAKEYAQLRKIVEKEGLFKRQPIYYSIKIFYTIALLALSLAAVVVFKKSPFLEILNSIFLAAVFVQIAGLSHDAGHQEIGASTNSNETIVMVLMGLFLGTSSSWWIDKHNAHHAKPNEEDMDPDIQFPVLAFTEAQAKSKNGIFHFIVKYQTFFFPFLVLLVTFNMRMHSIRILIQDKARHRIVEAIFMLVYIGFFVFLALSQLGIIFGLFFILLDQMVAGLYLSLIFAPNHKGMPMIKKGTSVGFLYHQILTSRNVRGSFLVDFFFLGLNYQIEHHLFPNMPRNNLGKAQKTVLAFCKKRNISYYETSAGKSYLELFSHLWRVSAVLRV